LDEREQQKGKRDQVNDWKPTGTRDRGPDRCINVIGKSMIEHLMTLNAIRNVGTITSDGGIRRENIMAFLRPLIVEFHSICGIRMCWHMS
jgi:hypothetical protein